MSGKSTENTENICVVCFKNVEIYSIGSCDHMVCYECSTRMRVLCRQNECPICRQELPKVVFTSSVRPFNEIQNILLLEDKKFKIYFENKKIQDAFNKLLEHSCAICPKSPTFKAFQNLYDHMKKQHDLHYCDLCVEHLKIFSSERQSYTPKNLDQHKKTGDVDDRSHRGHPLCQFCNVRYMDNDCLYRHLRRDHLYCHFCDADGLDLYYSSYDYLREHFRNEHYLCEEGSCVDEKFTPVFRTDIDLKAHRASAHGRTLGKAAAKQARTLELEFTLKPRPRQLENSKKGRGAGLNEASVSEEAVGGAVEQCSRTNLPNLNSSEFPSLPSGSNVGPVVVPHQKGRSHGLTVHAFGKRNAPLDMSEENFPVLGVASDSTIPGTSVKVNANQVKSTSGHSRNATSRNLSSHLNHKSSGEQNIKIRQDDFPSLSSSKKVQANPVPVNWARIKNKKPEPAPSEATSAALNKPKAPKLNGTEDFPSLNSKFNVNLKLKANEPTKSSFVNVKTYKNNKVDDGKEKRLTAGTTSAQGDWLDVAETSGSAKSKSKKKKSKGNNVEDKSDTAKKKQDNKRSEDTKVQTCQKSEKDSQTSALTKSGAKEPASGTLVKPLPKAEDWFEELRKGGSSSKSQRDEELGELRNCLADVSSHFSFPPGKLSGSVTGINNNVCPSKSSDAKAPPGFDNFNGCFNNNDVKKPPPGFASNFPTSNGLTFADGSGQGFPILTEFEYTPPVDFEKRNQKLVSKVNKIISNDTNLEQFRKKSILFRQNLLTAREYYEHCEKAMDDKGLREVFPELLVLLPDIGKQQELFQVYSESSNFCNSSTSLDVCVTCNQVIGAADAKDHFLNHSIDQNFPSLKVHQWAK